MNIRGLENIVQTFYDISGMDIAVIDSKNRIVARRYLGNRFCALLHRSPKCLKMCEQSDSLRMSEAKGSGELVTYTCPFGIFEAIAPIKKNNEVVGYLFLGMGLEARNGCHELPLARALEHSPLSDREELEKSIGEIPKYTREKLMAYAEMLPILAEYIENNNLLEGSSRSIGQLTKDYIKKNLSHKITLADLSWNLHFSTVTLTEHFKKEFGMTITEYILQKRMKKAAQMLSNDGDISVKEVSEACGFADIEYFSRSFKQYYGASPSIYRKQARADGEKGIT
ncbi:MAG: helix-turn-helix domain-containing protein [Ruminococcaceae bacterium]|nr:helix-turn-helix domain-containing protein [Oscillospiraceae bacterium]